MPTVSFTISAGDITRAGDAFDKAYPGRPLGPTAEDPDAPPAMTKADWLKFQIVRFMKEVVKAQEVQSSVEQTRKTVTSSFVDVAAT